jgi:hypothetical protein
MTAHLALMSKPRLIQLVTAIEKRAQQNADLADYWRSVTNGLIDTAPKPDFTPSPETTLAEARRILRGLPVDPLAEEHRDTLRAALNHGGRTPQDGDRCTRGNGAGVCGRLLNVHGFCSHCERAATNRAKAAA